jgi:hypothetical protein
MSGLMAACDVRTRSSNNPRAHPGRNVYHFVEPWRPSFQEIAEFITGEQADVADDRVLSTVLFTDIVDSRRRAAEMGDRDWHALLDAHDVVVRSQLSRFRGREVNTSGDGFLAMFDGPQRAIRCAMAIRDAVQALGIEGARRVAHRRVPGSGRRYRRNRRAHRRTGQRTGRAERRAGVKHAARPCDRVRRSSSITAEITNSRACPDNGASSPSPLRSGGFGETHFARRKGLCTR